MSGEVLRFDADRRTNARMIADVARLGLIDESMLTLDATWGLGAWWRDWTPTALFGLDLDPAKARDVRGDFWQMPFPDGTFDLVCFDPPYAYRGTSRHAMDDQYGLATDYMSPPERDHMISSGITECARVTRPGGVLIVKCQDQVVSGRPRMQSHGACIAAEFVGCRLLSVLEVAGGVRKQRSQRTVRNNTSQALVFSTSPCRMKEAA